MISTVYLAGPIDLGGDIAWKDSLTQKLTDKRISLISFNPATAFKLTIPNMDKEISKYIEGVNNVALDMADLVICSLPKGVQTIGTIVELDRCRRLGKKVILLTNVDIYQSAYLLNRVDPCDVVYFCEEQGSIDESLDLIVDKVLRMNGAYNQGYDD
jgi:nucleoside 2-deoxyribosyltransferase